MDDATGPPESYQTLVGVMVVEVRLPANTGFPYASEVRTNVEIEFEPEPPTPICS